MEEGISGTLNLDRIRDLTQVSIGKAKQLMETCVWAFINCNHTNGVIITVIEDKDNASYAVSWSEEELDTEAVLRSYNKDDATQFGAEAMALLISVERTPYDAVERSTTKTGIDYWLGFKNRHPNEPFHRASRLEISGIMIETPKNKVIARVKDKLSQTTPTDHTLPVGCD